MPNIIFGADIARFGEDSSVIAIREDNRVLPLIIYNKLDTMAIANTIGIHADEYQPSSIFVDVIGVGSGVVDRLAQVGYPVVGVNVAEKSHFPEKFTNLKSELWWNLRIQLNPKYNNPIKIPDDKLLFDELRRTSYIYDEKGRLRIEKKDKIKKMLGRSPDRADAVVLAAINSVGESGKGSDVGLKSNMELPW